MYRPTLNMRTIAKHNLCQNSLSHNQNMFNYIEWQHHGQQNILLNPCAAEHFKDELKSDVLRLVSIETWYIPTQRMYHFWSHHQRSLKTTSIRHLKGLELRNGRHIFLVDSLHSSMSRGMKRGPTFQKTYVKLHNPCAYFIWESRKHRFFSALVLFYKRTRFWLQFSVLHTFLPQKNCFFGTLVWLGT